MKYGNYFFFAHILVCTVFQHTNTGMAAAIGSVSDITRFMNRCAPVNIVSTIRSSYQTRSGYSPSLVHQLEERRALRLCGIIAISNYDTGCW
jgi:hypothetical protein